MAERLPVLALTLWRPWDWAIFYGTKRVENRDWEPPKHVVGRYIALHAGMTYDTEGALKMSAAMHELGISAPPPDERCPKGVIAGVVKVVGGVELVGGGDDAPPSLGAVVGQLTEDQVELVLKSPWATGPWCWVLEDVTPLVEPVPCRGARKLWRVPDEIAGEIRKRYAEMKRLRCA